MLYNLSGMDKSGIIYSGGPKANSQIVDVFNSNFASFNSSQNGQTNSQVQLDSNYINGELDPKITEKWKAQLSQIKSEMQEKDFKKDKVAIRKSHFFDRIPEEEAVKAEIRKKVSVKASKKLFVSSSSRKNRRKKSVSSRSVFEIEDSKPGKHSLLQMKHSNWSITENVNLPKNNGNWKIDESMSDDAVFENPENDTTLDVDLKSLDDILKIDDGDKIENKRSKREKSEDGSTLASEAVAGIQEVVRWTLGQDIIIKFIIGAIAGILIFGTIFTGIGFI